MFSLVVPVYRNEENVPALLDACATLNARFGGEFEVVFVVDGSPDRSLQRLSDHLPRARFRSRLMALSRNFGPFAAMRAGLAVARGDIFAVMAADLQEPLELMEKFFRALKNDDCDVAFGCRASRADPVLGRIASVTFWWCYRRFIQRDMPEGGIDVFACNRTFRDQLLSMRESNSSLVGLAVWMGYRRLEIPYARLKREEGRSAWTLRRKLRYFFDSVFSFSDLPFQILLLTGTVTVGVALVLGVVVLIQKLFGQIPVAGYAALVLMIMFFSGLQMVAFGVIGGYLFRTFENTKGRPEYLIQSMRTYETEN
ncbi:MAG: glycosyltransferase family 2 protein [Candidatus Hydrogenedentes bacterium]|nr:glycosyltransferase family 2 protein [Candidatus Hydrogenedentota bacterium]